MNENKDKTSIWIVFHSRKGGHLYPSKALYDYIKSNYDSFVPALINLLDVSPLLSFIDSIGRHGDLNLKSLYKKGYQQLQKQDNKLVRIYKIGEGLILKTSKVRGKLLWRYGRPDLIISTQPEVNVIAHTLKTWFLAQIHTVIIDLAIHGLWVNKWIDHYYVANDHIKKELMAYGVNADSISVTGIPLRSGFAQTAKSDIKQLRNRLKISAELPTILLMGGLLGTMVDYQAVIKSIIEKVSPYQLLVVFGRNEKDRNIAATQKLQAKYPVHIYGTVSNVDEMIWASDIVVSKPGSVTMAETLSLGKPMVVITPRAGSAQELRFAKFLVDNGAGSWTDRADKVGELVNSIFSSEDTYKKMSKNAWGLGHYSLHANENIMSNVRVSLMKCSRMKTKELINE